MNKTIGELLPGDLFIANRMGGSDVIWRVLEVSYSHSMRYIHKYYHLKAVSLVDGRTIDLTVLDFGVKVINNEITKTEVMTMYIDWDEEVCCFMNNETFEQINVPFERFPDFLEDFDDNCQNYNLLSYNDHIFGIEKI